MEKRFIAAVLALTVFTGCSSTQTFKTIQITDPELVNHFAGKQICFSVSKKTLTESGSIINTSPRFLIEKAEKWANTSVFRAFRVNLTEETIFSGGIPLLGNFDQLQNDEKASIPVYAEIIKSTLVINECDCLLLYSSADAGVATNSVLSGLKATELLSRFGSALVSHTSTSSSGGSNVSSGEAINRSMIYYTCGGEKPLFLAAMQGGAIHDKPEEKVFELLNAAGTGKMVNTTP